jgi:hypothetical protein
MAKRITKAQALALAHKKFGKRAMIRDSRHPTSEAGRIAAMAKLREHREHKPTMPKVDNTEAIPDSMTMGEYRQRLYQYRREYKEWSAVEDLLQNEAYHKRYAVGKDEGFTFWVRGSGDTWAEALRAAGCM